MKNTRLPLYFLLFLLAIFAYTQKAKIVADIYKPISGNRTIITNLLPVFQMKIVQVAGMIEIGTDTTFTIVYYLSIPELQSDQNVDLSNQSTTILLSDGSKVTGQYLSTADVMGLKVVSYRFTEESFRRLANESAIAYTVHFGGSVGEYSLDPKYKDNIKIVCKTLIDKL